ncbi:MAG: O-antigen ligase family protein, partial [Clostridia bacterium]|nr:O-antigen ligase family protein [Clostridia bacterium]
DEDMINWMQKILIILLVCIGISSIFILSKDSDAAKLTATGLSNNYWFLIEYSTVYGLAVAFPCLLVWVKKSKRKTRKIVFICLMALCLFMASFLIALIAIILGIISYIFLNFKDKLIRYGLLFIFVGILVYIFVSGKLENFLLQLASMIPVENISLRLEELVEFFQTGDTEGGSVSRLQMYSNSIKGWLRHPIFGNILFNNDVILSGHSTNLDLLNACGIILFVPYIMFVINIFRFNRYKETKKKSAVIASFISFLFISTCNPVFSSPAIFVFYILGPTIFIGKTNLKERKICEPLK